jgi:hypothetical protein
MSTAGGPKLAGIGPGAAPEIVMCLDARDAGSYPGQPATNYISSVTGWPGSAGVGPATPFTLGEFGQLRNLSPIFDTYGLVPYTLSMDIKTNIPGGVYVYMQNGSYTKYSFVALSVTCTTEYQRFTFANLTPAGPTANWLTYTPTDERAMLAMYTGYGSGINPTVKNIQLELGAYATPFVEPRLADIYAQGYSARPVSVNLMIHGNVGSGQSFSDSSPSKHAIGAVGNTTHSNTQSKFSGGSVYFDGNGDRLSVSSHADFGFGTGSFTVDCWVYKIATVAWETFVDTYSYVNNGFICGLKDSDSTIAFYSEGGTGWNYAGGTALALNTWYHLAWVRDGNNFRMFVNGTQQGSTFTFSSSDNYTEGQLLIGSRASAQYINGYMDEIRVTKGTALWTQSFTPPTRRNRSAPVVDLSGSDTGGNFSTKDMTDVATYRDGQVIEPVASAVWDFDGTDDRMKLPSQNDAQALCAWGDFTGADNTNYSICMWVLSGGPQGSSSLDAPGLLARSNGDIYANLTIYNGVICFVHYNGSWLYNIIAISIEDAKWHHVAYVNTSSQIGTLYIDGVQQNYSQSSSIVGSNYFSPDYIGYGYNNKYFLGKISAAQVYQVALTSSQVKQSFNAHCNRFKVGPPAIVRSGLQLELDAAKHSGSGSTWYDLSGNNYDITLVGSPTWNSAGYFDFNGSSQFGHHTFASAIGTQTAVTTEVWVNADSISGWDSMFDMHNDDYLMALLNGQLSFYDPTHYSGYTVSIGTWYQLVIAYNSAGTSYFYANGASVGSFTNTITKAPTIISVAAGYSSPSSGNEYFDGQMAMLNWYNRQLTAVEVGNNFQAGRERFSL